MVINDSRYIDMPYFGSFNRYDIHVNRKSYLYDLFEIIWKIFQIAFEYISQFIQYHCRNYFFLQLHISGGKFSAKVWYLYQLFMCREKTLQTKFYQTTLTSICASPVKKHVIYSNLLSLHHFLFHFVNFFFDTFYIIHKIYLYCIEKMRVINFG